MVIPVINYQSLEPQGNPAARGMLPAILQGMKLGFSPYQMKAELEQYRLANALKKLELQYAPEMNEAELGYKNAQIPHLNAQTRQLGLESQFYPELMRSRLGSEAAETELARKKGLLPFGGASLPGVSGDIMALEAMKLFYGENSPQYKEAIERFNLERESDRSRIDYQNALTRTMPTRMLTPFGKQFGEQGNVASGLSPSGEPWKFTPIKSPEELTNLYNLKTQKDVTDTGLRERTLFAQNIHKTLSQLNVDDLTRYAGAQGTLEKTIQQGKAPFGKESQDYDNHEKSLTAVKLLTKQIRQMYGDSIQPSILEAIEQLANPSSLGSNPRLAKEKFNKLVNILDMEIKTFTEGLQSTQPYTQNNNLYNQELSKALTIDQNDINNLKQSGIGKVPKGGMIIVESPSGKKFQVPSENLQKLLTDHPEFKRVQ